MAQEAEGHTKHMTFDRGTFRTPDRVGFVEFDTENKEWIAWRDDKPGVTANCDSFEEAEQYAFHG